MPSMRQSFLSGVLLCTLSLMLPPAAYAGPSACDAVAGNLVLNCGFEGGVYSSTIGGHTNNGVPNNWTPNAAFDLEPGFNFVTNGNPHTGSNDLSIGNYDAEPLAALSQPISDVAGAVYTASFWAYAGAGGDPNAFLRISIDGTSETVFDSFNTWTQFTFFFTGNGSDTLTIEAQTNPSEWYVDDIVITGATAGVAEPSSILLLSINLLGAAVLGLGLKLRKSVAVFHRTAVA
jgi:hypothetical protein